MLFILIFCEISHWKHLSGILKFVLRVLCQKTFQSVAVLMDLLLEAVREHIFAVQCILCTTTSVSSEVTHSPMPSLEHCLLSDFQSIWLGQTVQC